jgi:hypothetical protein
LLELNLNVATTKYISNLGCDLKRNNLIFCKSLSQVQQSMNCVLGQIVDDFNVFSSKFKSPPGDAANRQPKDCHENRE